MDSWNTAVRKVPDHKICKPLVTGRGVASPAFPSLQCAQNSVAVTDSRFMSNDLSERGKIIEELSNRNSCNGEEAQYLAALKELSAIS